MGFYKSGPPLHIQIKTSLTTVQANKKTTLRHLKSILTNHLDCHPSPSSLPYGQSKMKEGNIHHMYCRVPEKIVLVSALVELISSVTMSHKKHIFQNCQRRSYAFIQFHRVQKLIVFKRTKSLPLFPHLFSYGICRHDREHQLTTSGRIHPWTVYQI